MRTRTCGSSFPLLFPARISHVYKHIRQHSKDSSSTPLSLSCPPSPFIHTASPSPITHHPSLITPHKLKLKQHLFLLQHLHPPSHQSFLPAHPPSILFPSTNPHPLFIPHLIIRRNPHPSTTAKDLHHRQLERQHAVS